MAAFLAINMCSSLDGKIASAKRGKIHMGSPRDRQRMREIRRDKHAIIMGASTFRVYPRVLDLGGKSWEEWRKRKKLSPQPATVLVSTNLSLPRRTPWEKASLVDRLVFCGKRTPKARQQSFIKSGVKVFPCPTIRPKPSFIVQRLSHLGYKNLLLEGGGELNASFLEADLVDRIYLTLCPHILGGAQAPSICEGKGFSLQSVPLWKLQECKERKNELYLIYDRQGRSYRSISS